jgi:DNA replication protein DnaC
MINSETSMQRHEIIEMARELKLPGIVRCFDEVIRSATQHQWRPQEVVAELFRAEMAEKTARSIRYQMNAAKFPVAKSLAEFDFTASTVNEETAAFQREVQRFKRMSV